MNRDGKQLAPGAQREWTIGIAVVIAAVLIALAVAAYLTFWNRAAQKPSPVARVDVRQVCLTGLSEAKRWGILPDYARLATSNIYGTKREGRYACATSTPAASYAVVVDLLCAQLGSDKCVKLVGVSRDDGAVLFKNLH